MPADLIVGIAPLGHDLSATIARRDGSVLFVGEEERYSAVKGGEFVLHPARVLSMLAEVGAAADDVSVIAPAGDPLAGVSSESVPYPASARTAHRDAWLEVYARTFPRASIRPPLRHHRAHAASSYFTTQSRNAAVVTIDAHGDGECCTISVGEDDTLQTLERQVVPDSVTYLYRTVSTYVGLRGHEREGKLMALAAYGQPSLAGELGALFFEHRLYPARATASIRERPCRVSAWLPLLVERFGPPRAPSAPLTQLHMDLAASAQQLFGDYVMSVLRHARAITGAVTCCAAGGAFVNSVSNGRARRERPFPTLFLPAWASDVGLSIGAAAVVLAENGVRMRLRNAYLGSPLDVEAVPTLARERGLACARVEDPFRRAAACVEAGQIVGWAQGRAEIGPRALGNRSIFANAASPHIRHELNRRKRRESWRPFGVSVLQEELTDESRYMNLTVGGLGAAYVSALHVDGSCRIHTVSDGDNPPLTELLREMKARIGTGVVINTSLNGPRQPIARTAAECLDTYLALGLDALFIGPFQVTGRRHGDSAIVTTIDGSLPEPFHLVIPFDDNTPVLRTLKTRAARTTVEPGLLIASNSRSPVMAVDDAHIVVYNPWYNAVLHHVLPRVTAWAVTAAATRDVTVIDKRGEALTLADHADRPVDLLWGLPTTDVEGHLLRRLGREVAGGEAPRDA